LYALTRLDYPRDRFEVIVVDDGSAVPLDTVVAPFQKQLDLAFLQQAHAGPATARNTGAGRARGEILAFTDDDCIPVSNWLLALTTRFAMETDHALGGRTLNALPDNLYATATHLLLAYLSTVSHADPDRSWFFPSNNLALPADRFRAIGGFDPAFRFAAGEDRDLCDRWLQHGYQMTYAPEALVYHACTLTLCSFWRQHFTYGRGGFRLRQARTQRGFGGAWPEPLMFYLRLLASPLTQLRSRRTPPLAMLLVLSQIANASGFFWEKRLARAALRGKQGQYANS
jgi:GT2 family glycosyltransferase